MGVKFLDLTRQYEILKEKIEPAVCKHMATGVYIGGQAINEFEKKFAAYIGVKYAVSVNSGTDALVISLRAMGIEEGDEIITTPFTFFATAEAIAMAGAIPVFADIDDVSYNISPDEIREKISARTKGILLVHIFGNPANMDEINQIAEENDLFVIEDACQSVGASYYGKMTGSMGAAGCFSFFPTKNLGAFGDAGMITTNDENTAIVCRALKEHGMGKNGAAARYILEGIPDELTIMEHEDAMYNPYKYYNYLLANNSRMDALQAVVLNIKLDYLCDFLRKREKIANFYTNELRQIEGIRTPATNPDGIAVWHQYAIRCEEKEKLLNYLSEHDIGCAAFYPVPLHLQKAFQYLNYKTGDFPIAERLCRETVCLPIYPELTDGEIMEVCNAIKDFYNRQ